MTDNFLEQLKDISPEQATEIRRALKGKSKYAKKGVYREKENKVRFLNPNEWDTVIYNIPEHLRKYYWFLFLTGMRYREAKHVKLKHIEWTNRTITIFKPKGGIQRHVNFSSFGKRKLKDMFELLHDDDTLKFPTIQHLYQTLHKVCKKNEIRYWQDISVHNLRKQHENYLIALNLQPTKITAHMGHTMKTAAEHYNSSEFIKDSKQLEKIKGWLGDIFG